jgi:hypothetical protein
MTLYRMTRIFAGALAALALPALPGCFSCNPRAEICGDGFCVAPEDQFSCPDDCGFGVFCGDGFCDLGFETCDSCPNDCAVCECVPNGFCEAGETCPSCPDDCCGPACGDGNCNPDEQCGLVGFCPADCPACPTCGDQVCDTLSGETCTDCPADCGVCASPCGNGLCEPGESCADCARECLCLSPGLHEFFPATPDLAGTVLSFTPDSGGYFQTWACAAELPVTPGSGTLSSYVAGIAAEGSEMIAFPFGFPFFGALQSTAWADANGHLTFFGADPGSGFDLAGFYLLPRIAPLYTDLGAGTITVDQFAGRVTVTWDLPGGAAGGAASFQASLEPTGAIELAYGTTLDVDGAFVGLSAGASGTGTAVDLAPGGCSTEWGSPGVYQQWFGDNDLDGAQITYLWTGTGYVVWGTSGNTVLPEGLGAGTVASANYEPDDDLPIQHDLAGAVAFFGGSYATIWLSPNGYVLFDGPSSTYSESATEHFARVQLSLLFDDLNPIISGVVWVDEYADHLTISYDDVSEFGMADSNTFQAQLWDDGTIVATYLAIDAMDGLAGISDGNPGGLPLPGPLDLVP